MTNGTTGFPVAPIAEEEAMRLSTMFSRAADAIIAASSMPKTIENLQGQVFRLSQDLEARTLHADELDRTIHELREQRDQARAATESVNREYNAILTANADNVRTIHEQQTQIDSLSADLAVTKRDRDDAHYKVLELDDELAKAKAALADIQAKVAAFFPQATPKAAEPEPTPNPTSEAVSSTAEPSQDIGHPAPVDLPKWEDMQSPKASDPERRYLESWEPGASWDESRRSYYLDH